MKKWALLLGVISAALVAATAMTVGGNARRAANAQPAHPVASIRIAIITHPYSTLLAVAHGGGFFNAEGIEATLHPFASGKEGLQAVVEGRADITTAADTGVAESLLKGVPLKVAAVVGSSDASHKIIARKDSGIAAPSDLRGKKVAVTFGTFGDFYLDTFLTLNDIRPEAITKVDLKPREMPAALFSGKVDAASSWDPATMLLAEGLGRNAVEFRNYPPVITSHSLVLHEELVERRPELVERIIRALLKAEQFAAEHPAEAQAMAAPLVGTDREGLARLWKNYSYHVMLDQDLIVRLEEQARWLIEKKGVPQRIPNLLPHFHVAALQAAAPDAVSLIHKNRP